MSITEKKAKIRKVQAPEQCAPVPPDGTPEEEKPLQVKRTGSQPSECPETPRSPDSDKIIKGLIKRHRGVLERLAKL